MGTFGVNNSIESPGHMRKRRRAKVGGSM